MKHTRSKLQKGFTLLETLVAIAIMTVSIGAAFSMAQKSLSASYSARNQTTAYFLAAEGLELVRTIRDNVSLYNLNGNGSLDWIQPLRPKCTSVFGCDINPAAVNLSVTGSGIGDPAALLSCDPAANPNADSTGCKLKLYALGPGKNIYTSQNVTGALSTLYTRTIKVNETIVSDGTNKKEAQITSTVSWLGQNVSITETLTNWH